MAKKIVLAFTLISIIMAFVNCNEKEGSIYGEQPPFGEWIIQIESPSLGMVEPVNLKIFKNRDIKWVESVYGRCTDIHESIRSIKFYTKYKLFPGGYKTEFRGNWEDDAMSGSFVTYDKGKKTFQGTWTAIRKIK